MLRANGVAKALSHQRNRPPRGAVVARCDPVIIFQLKHIERGRGPFQWNIGTHGFGCGRIKNRWQIDQQ
jgi:hypothetical protein